MTDYLNPGAYWQQRLKQAFDLTGAGYSALGPAYNRQLYAVRIDALARLLDEQGVDLRQAAVLEIGCGTGYYTDWLLRRGARSYTGIDITAVSVQRLQERHPQARFVQADLTAAALPVREQFDLVLIADVLIHIVDDRLFAAAIRNAASAVKPDGLLVLSDILATSDAQLVAHCRWRSYDSYRAALGGAGLKPVHLLPIFAALQPPADLPTNPRRWQLYSLLWQRVLFRLARMAWFDRYGSAALALLDRHLLLPLAGVATPNSKWLAAAHSVSPDA